MTPASTPAGVRCANGAIVKIAANRRERAGAFALAYRSYLHSGLCDANRSGMRFTPHQLTPSTDTFVALRAGEVISTLSLTRDSELRLPLESIYPREVHAKRTSGVRLGEVTCLADNSPNQHQFVAQFTDLARLMMQTAERDGIQQLLIAVHPRHARAYCRAMGFEQIAGRRRYGAVNDELAVALCLDFAFVRRHKPRIWGRFVGPPLPASVLAPCPITESDRQYFSQMTRLPEVA